MRPQRVLFYVFRMCPAYACGNRVEFPGSGGVAWDEWRGQTAANDGMAGSYAAQQGGARFLAGESRLRLRVLPFSGIKDLSARGFDIASSVREF
jgi:hypothetical protein